MLRLPCFEKTQTIYTERLHGREQGPAHVNEDFSDLPGQPGHQLNTAKCVTTQLLVCGAEEPAS